MHQRKRVLSFVAAVTLAISAWFFSASPTAHAEDTQPTPTPTIEPAGARGGGGGDHTGG